MSQSENRDEVLFRQALLQQSPAERAAYLDQACQGDPALRARLDLLLEGHFHTKGFLQTLPQGRGHKGAPGELTEKPGDRIGRYKLLQKIGEGGCGVVYMAQQEQPVRRRVALKIIKLGMDTRQVIARFEAERQALALMDHANIAKVFDAGATETGRPYFVMELIRGVRITEYCDEKNLSTRERLVLFGQVCHAIQHAHQKGIIHRDIKPSNVLVTVNDGLAIPKVIDFGIAKATSDQRLSNETVFTAFEQFIGTPAYMSPEQAEITSVDIDTRSDIYSLGVLLYELLTGKTPFDAKELFEVGLDAMRRTICQKEPERPSTRVSTLAGEDRTTTARRRGLDAPRLVNLLRGDLDWIVMKCLEKERARRYETANGLATDLQRHLDNEPVLACPPSNLYRFQKMVRRNKLAFAAGSALLFCLIFGLLGVTWGLFKEREARKAVEALRAQEHALLQKAQTAGKIDKAKQLYGQQRRDEAERVLNELLPAEIEPNKDHADLRRRLGWWYAIHEEYDRSASNLALLGRVNGLGGWGDITVDLKRQCIVLVQKGDIAGYEALRQRVLATYLQTTNPIIAERVCEASLLLPANQATLALLAKPYEAMERSQGDPDFDPDPRAWVSLAMAILDYRRGDFLKAITNCQTSLAAPARTFQSRMRVPVVEAVLAMSYHQLHQDEEAGGALAEARDGDYDNLLKVNGEAEMALFDGLFGQILAREAGALIEGHAAADGLYYISGETYLGDYYDRGANGGRSTANLLEAVKWYRKAIEHGSPEAPAMLGILRATSPDPKIRDLAEAMKWHRIAAERGSAQAATTLGERSAAGATPKLRDLYQLVAQNWLSWLLATSADPKIRDGTNAVRFAERSVAATNRRDPGMLDTLAAAYAETGQFEKAIATETEAIALDPKAPERKDFDSHLTLFESGKPWRE